MKPSIDFENISHSEAEKRTLAKFREVHEKDDPRETFKLWFFIGLSFILAITGVCFIIVNVNWKYVARWFNDLETWQYSVGILFILCVVSVSWSIVRSGRKNQTYDR